MAPKLREGPLGINAELARHPQPAQVRAALDRVRSGLLADGGNIELIAVDPDGTVRLALQGECSRCPAAEMTIRRVIEPVLRAHVPGITAIVMN